MAQIHNAQLSKEIIDGAKVQLSMDKVPNQIADKVVPVMEVNPKLFRSCNIVENIYGSAGTIYTTPTDKDFFLTSATLSYNKSVADSGTNAFIKLTLPGQGESIILTLPGITLTAEKLAISSTFNPPILIKRGTNIYTSGANITTICSNITGYSVAE